MKDFGYNGQFIKARKTKAIVDVCAASLLLFTMLTLLYFLAR